MIKRKEYRYLDDCEVSAIKTTLAQLGISQNELATRLGITKGLLCMVLKGKRALTKDLQKRFERIGFII